MVPPFTGAIISPARDGLAHEQLEHQRQEDHRANSAPLRLG